MAGEREVAVGDVFVELLMDTAACVIGRCGGEEEEEEEEESGEVLRLTASIWWREVEVASRMVSFGEETRPVTDWSLVEWTTRGRSQLNSSQCFFLREIKTFL